MLWEIGQRPPGPQRPGCPSPLRPTDLSLPRSSEDVPPEARSRGAGLGGHCVPRYQSSPGSSPGGETGGAGCLLSVPLHGTCTSMAKTKGAEASRCPWLQMPGLLGEAWPAPTAPGIAESSRRLLLSPSVARESSQLGSARSPGCWGGRCLHARACTGGAAMGPVTSTPAALRPRPARHLA